MADFLVKQVYNKATGNNSAGVQWPGLEADLEEGEYFAENTNVAL